MLINYSVGCVLDLRKLLEVLVLHDCPRWKDNAI